MSGYIYGFVDQNNKIFYIGQTINPKSRIRGHKMEVERGNKLYCYNKLRKVLNITGKKIRDLFVILESNIPIENLDEKEIEYIRIYRENGYKLANLTNGGKGALTFPNYIQKKAGLKRKGRKFSEYTKKKISDSRKGIKFSDEHRENLSKARRKRITTQETRIKASKTSTGKINIKKYILTNPYGIEYTTENGLRQFCREHNLQSSILAKVLVGERKHHKGWSIKRYEQQ